MTLRRLVRNKSAMAGLVILVLLLLSAIFAPQLAPYDPLKMDFRARLSPPSADHWFGTNEFGRDIFSMILYGSRISIMVGFISVSFALVIGVILGVIAGYFDKLDNLIMRITDVWLAFPTFLLAIAIVAVLGPGLTNAMIAVGIASTPQYIRVVRGAVLSVKEQEYIAAAKALGATNRRIVLNHVLPNVVAPIIVLSTLRFATAILSAAGLSFLGLGVQPPTPEWGAMAYASRSYIRQAWWLGLFPGLAILLMVLGFNLLGDGLRDVLDPRMKQ
ncbi:MAG: ABC transporter permease [Firmicutes bacterium]|nr:ABC transporter permease [Bacillota bacterium]